MFSEMNIRRTTVLTNKRVRSPGPIQNELQSKMQKLRDFRFSLNEMFSKITQDGVFNMYPQFAVSIQITPKNVTLTFMDENNDLNTITIERNSVPRYADIKEQVLKFFEGEVEGHIEALPPSGPEA